MNVAPFMSCLCCFWVFSFLWINLILGFSVIPVLILCFVLVFLKTFGGLLRWFSVFVLVLNLWRRRGGSTTLRTASKRLNTCDSHQLLHLKKHRQQPNKGSPAAFKLQARFTSRFPLIVLTCVIWPHLGLGHFAVPSSLPCCLCLVLSR